MRQSLTFEGVENFRDFGALAIADGRRIKPSRLFRGAHFAAATVADVARLDDLGIRLVADLRHPAERAAAPSVWPGPAGPTVIFREPEPAPPPQQAPPPPTPQPFSAAIAWANMLGAYRRIPVDPGAIGLVRRLLYALAEGGGPIVVHCTSGKDRTGVACAVIQAALGVAPAEILADYLGFNDGLDRSRRRDSVRAGLEPEIGRPLSDEEIEPLLGAERAYFAAAMSQIDAVGGMDAYLRGPLGVTDGVREALRRQLCA